MFVSTYLLGCSQEIELHTPEAHEHHEVLEVFEAPKVFLELLLFFEVDSSLVRKSTKVVPHLRCIGKSILPHREVRVLDLLEDSLLHDDASSLEFSEEHLVDPVERTWLILVLRWKERIQLDNQMV
jgi:hypothetical protein